MSGICFVVGGGSRQCRCKRPASLPAPSTLAQTARRRRGPTTGMRSCAAATLPGQYHRNRAGAYLLPSTRSTRRRLTVYRLHLLYGCYAVGRLPSEFPGRCALPTLSASASLSAPFASPFTGDLATAKNCDSSRASLKASLKVGVARCRSVWYVRAIGCQFNI